MLKLQKNSDHHIPEMSDDAEVEKLMEALDGEFQTDVNSNKNDLKSRKLSSDHEVTSIGKELQETDNLLAKN